MKALKIQVLLGAGLLACVLFLGPLWSGGAAEKTPASLTETPLPEIITPESAPTESQSNLPKSALIEAARWPEDDSARIEQERLANQQAELAREVRQLRADLQAVLNSLAQNKSADNIPTPESQADSDHFAESLENENFARLESAFLGQGYDPYWSEDAESALWDSLGAALVNPTDQLLSAQCSNALCRIETVHVETDSMETFLEQVSTAITWDHSGMVKVDTHDDGAISVVMLVNREGYDFSPYLDRDSSDDSR